MGPRIPATTLNRFWTMLAHVQGGLFNAAQLARGPAVDGKIVVHYLDLLSDLMLIRRLQPFQSNIGKRLVKSPKVFISDSGIVHALLNITDKEALLGHPVAGASWEGFVIENLINAAPARTLPMFYRTATGAEIDLLLEIPGNGKGGGLGNGSGDGLGDGGGGGTGGGVFRAGGDVSSPVLVSKVEPEYSEAARRAKYSGSVLLSVVVDEHGMPQDIHVVRPLGLGLDEKAVEAVQRWRFRPGLRNGKPVKVLASIEVSFRLL